MSGHPMLKTRSLFSLLVVSILMIAVACGGSAATPVVIEKEVVKEVEKQVVVEKEVIKEVPKEVVVEKEVVKEVIKEVLVVATPKPAPKGAAKIQLGRLILAIPQGGGSDTNLTWVTSRGGTLDERPALEHPIGVDRFTGAYEPQLVESWESSADFSTWTLNLRQGIPFHYGFGEFTAKDLRHSLFLITQAEAVVTDAGSWRRWIGSTPAELQKNVEIVDDHTVNLHLSPGGPEFLGSLSLMYGDVMIQSKDFWDAEGKEGHVTKVVGTGPFELVERKLGQSLRYERVKDHWRQNPEFEELEFRWS